jgi:hypothetical protein
LTRARIRAPFDGEIISPKTTRQSNTIDNVKAKIDNVKAKIQDKEEKGGSTTSRQRFRTRRRWDLGQDPHWQDAHSPASWLHLRPVPH